MRPLPLERAFDEAEVGGKAAQLGAAIRAELPVPPGLALPVAFVEDVAAGDRGAIEELLGSCSAVEPPLAVRSSAVGEDSAQASFAGQHLTRLGVSGPDEVPDAVRAVHESGCSESALAYRERLGVVGEPQVGVVVQRLVVANTAGVLFTRNPATGADELVIEAAWGLGEAVVAGLVAPDLYRLSRDGEVLERMAGRKRVAVRLEPDGGTRQERVPDDLAGALCLHDRQLGELHEVARRCDEAFEGAHDLEWAFAGEELFLLQRRAVTRSVA